MCFLPEQLRWTLLPKERYGNSIIGRASNTQTSNWEVDTAPDLPQRYLRRHYAKWCYDVPLERYWRTNNQLRSIKLAFIIYRDFMQSFLSDFERRGNKNRELLEP